MTDRIAIVGAGAAGTAAAYGLRDADVDVTVLERRAAPGGRGATRRRDGCVYDVGANYLDVADEAVRTLVEGPLADELVVFEDAVWTVDATGEIAPGRDDGDAKWTGRAGIERLAGGLLDRADAAVAWDVDVAGVTRTDAGRWRLQPAPEIEAGSADALAEPFDAVVLTPPAPATAELLRATPIADGLREAARSIDYRPITTVAARYDRRVEWPYYALVDVSKTRDLGWIAREGCKPGHVPDGESLVILQASPAWSRAHRGVDDDRIADAATDRLAALLEDPGLAEPDWTDVVRWRHALTDDGLAEDVQSEPAAAGLHVAGDWVAGESRLNAALANGLSTAKRLRDEE